ncbi:hypothetical protein [Bacillus sp. FJAT-28004]|uniref:hypothetical protein n=1 Tax=Bacillus sp. FJAT-28004 TaxID=1679165 RepID=UPI0006B61439|nr:hypothetical protein [Bacillus sp. FJAT-28004]
MIKRLYSERMSIGTIRIYRKAGKRGSELNMSNSIAGDSSTQAPTREFEQVRNDDLNGSSDLKRNNVNQQAEAESGATINRLLAAKNRNKR